MTPAELTTTLARIGWSRREFARRLGRPGAESVIRRWRKVPPEIAEWLERIAEVVEMGLPLRPL